jgi:tetratricopeptide (TPR) repeat protein
VSRLSGLVNELELLNSAGRYEAARALGESLLNAGGSEAAMGGIRYQLAMAYLQSGQLDLGAALLADARLYFEARGNVRMVAECVASEAGLAVTRQQRDAVQIAVDAVAACRRLEVVPSSLEVRALDYLAGAYVTAGEYQKAAEAYEEAIERAGPLFDIRRHARLFNDAAIAYKELGRLDEATGRAMKAMAMFELLRDDASLARLENNLGLIFIARGDVNAARAHLSRSLELCEKAGLEHGRSHVLLSLCELNFAEGNLEQALGFAEQGLAQAERKGEGVNVAVARVWLGRVAEELGQQTIADLEFARAVDGFGRLGMRELLLNCHETYAEILEARGDLPRAYAHLKMTVALAWGK